MPSFQNLLRLIVNGDPVDESTINSILSQLDSNTRYLWELILSIQAGQNLVARHVSLRDDTFIGAAVTFDPDQQHFKPAIAVGLNVNGEFRIPDEAQVWGVVINKESHNLGDVLLAGWASLDLSVAVESPPPSAGTYYLSSTTPGKLTHVQPLAAIPVLRYDGVDKVLVFPFVAEQILDRHRHYKYHLKTRPAGEHLPPPPGGRHHINSPNPSVEGWLPANHPVFAGKAPPGAAFGYNLSVSPLRHLWPPVPLDAVYLEWDRGEVPYIGGTGVPLGPDGLVIVDANGIWWMSDCYLDVPWPNEHFGPGGDPEWTLSSGSSSSSSAPAPECPRELHMRLILYFLRLNVLSRANVVTSLQAAPESSHIVQVRCIDDTPARTGDLEILVSFDDTLQDTNDFGPLAIKRLNDNRFVRGPVVSAIKTSSPDISLVSSDSSGARHWGEVEIVSLSTVIGRELPVELVKLNGVTEEARHDVLALGFPPNRNSHFRCKAVVPKALTTDLEVIIVLELLATVPGTVPPLRITWRRIPYASTPQSIPTTDSPLTFPASPIPALTTDQYVAAQSAPFVVSPGDVILFSVHRDAASPDGYPGELHVIDKRIMITSTV
jgi:hypothetical protein